MPTGQKITFSTNLKRDMKTEFNPRACVTCPKCSTYPKYQDNTVYCPNCGFKVELKPHQCRPEHYWNEAVRKYELETYKERTTFVPRPPKKKNKEEEEFTPENEKKKRWPEAYHFSEDYFDGDGYYMPACSEESSRIRLGLSDATSRYSPY